MKKTTYKVFRDGLEEIADSPPFVSKTRDGHTVESYTIDGVQRFFVTLAGSHYCAHGNSIAEAVADAIWKDEKQRPSLDALKSEIQKAGRERKITLQEFRVLTGACSVGCKAALKQVGLDGSPMLARDVAKHFPEWGGKLLQVLEWA